MDHDCGNFIVVDNSKRGPRGCDGERGPEGPAGPAEGNLIHFPRVEDVPNEEVFVNYQLPEVANYLVTVITDIRYRLPVVSLENGRGFSAGFIPRVDDEQKFETDTVYSVTFVPYNNNPDNFVVEVLTSQFMVKQRRGQSTPSRITLIASKEPEILGLDFLGTQLSFIKLN